MNGFSEVTMTFRVANGVLNFSTSVVNGLTANQITGNGTASVTITATIAAINGTIADSNGLTYTPNPGYVGQDTIAISATDVAGNSITGSISLGQPFLINAPASLPAYLNQLTAITGMSLQDPDLPTNDSLTSDLTIQHGTLTFSTSVPGGLQSNEIVGNGTSFVAVWATLAQIDTTLAAMNGLVYAPISGYSGPDSLGITAIDPLLNTASANMALNVNLPLTIAAPGGTAVGRCKP